MVRLSRWLLICDGMKFLAIQLFGGMRTFESTAPTFFSNIVEANEADGWTIHIFIHTWSTQNNNEATGGNIRGIDFSEDESLAERIKTVYKPTAYKVSSPIVGADVALHNKLNSRATQKSKRAIVSSYTSLRNCNLLRLDYENKFNITYEYVLQTRPDVEFQSEFRIDRLTRNLRVYPEVSPFTVSANEFKDGALYSAYSADFPFAVEVSPRVVGCTDVFFISKPGVMNRVANGIKFVQDNLGDFVNHEALFHDMICSFNVEHKLISYLQHREWRIKRMDSSEELSDIENIDYKSQLKVRGRLKKVMVELLKLGQSMC